MRHHFLSVMGLCLIMSLPAKAAGLPANPWLYPVNQSNTEENSASASARAAELTEKINSQIENYDNMVQQTNDDSSPAQNVENLPSWQDIMKQVSPKKEVADTAPQQKESAVDLSDPLGIGKISQAVSDAQMQYNRAKATTGAYYNQAKNKLKQLEREAQSSVNEVQKMLK